MNKINNKINEFAKSSQLVDTIIKTYRKVRKDCGIPDNGWHSRTIECLATPFIKGHFTLAVVGKVSSEKSTFINALLGCKNLLPTGHDQTTCGLTYIEYGEKAEATIVFGDGHKKVIKDDISGKIKPHVAIPEKYHHLPVNNIDDMIMGGYDFKKIWEVHNQLEEETRCTPIDKALLKEYVEQRKKKDIAVEVRMKYPFNEELKGWRVIDTPGIGATGGIETRTKQLLATQKEDGSREVDAIIFLQNGSQTLDQSDTKKFVKEQLDNLTESDKDRLFYVLTHSGSSDFVTHKDSKIDFITQNYGSKIKVLTYADSLLYTFLTDLERSSVSLDEYENFDQPNDWADDEWNDICNIFFQAKRHLKKKKDSFNHDTMLRVLKEWSHFEELKNEINSFAKNEKQKTLKILLNHIATDYRGFISQLDKDNNLVDGDLAFINNEIKNVEEKKKEYNTLAADNLIKIDRINAEFDFIDEKMCAIMKLESIDSVRTAVTNLFDSVQKKEKEVFKNIIKKFSVFLKRFDSNDIIFESIDFDAIEKDVSKSYKEILFSTMKNSPFGSNLLGMIFTLYIETKYEKKKLRNFKAEICKAVRTRKKRFIFQLKVKVENMRKQISDELNTKIKEELKRLEDLKSQLGRKKKFKAENDAFIAKSSTALEELIKHAQVYGYKI